MTPPDIEPAEPLLRGVDRLVVSADGPLALVPFEALLTRDAPDARAARDAYLVGRCAVRYTPSASALALQRGGGSSGPIVAVGNPRFAPPGAEAGNGVPVALPNTAAPDARSKSVLSSAPPATVRSSAGQPSSE